MHVDHIVTQLRNTLNNNFSSSSSSNLNPSLPTDSNTNKTLSSCCCNGKLCRKQEMTSSECLYKHVFETVPSQREVEDAISALQE